LSSIHFTGKEAIMKEPHLDKEAFRNHQASLYKQAFRARSDAAHAKGAIVAFFERAILADGFHPSRNLFDGLAEFADSHAGPYKALGNKVRPSIRELSVGLSDSLMCQEPIACIKETLDEYFFITEKSARDELEANAEE
jgi:hypothetical protein